VKEEEEEEEERSKIWEEKTKDLSCFVSQADLLFYFTIYLDFSFFYFIEFFLRLMCKALFLWLVHVFISSFFCCFF
jgi:hypothetical protein